jgi:toxin ParE1/3/4
MRVRFSAQARVQYLEALDYLRERSPAAAAGLQQRAERMIAQLRAHPRSGHVLPEFPDYPYLEVLIEPYRFFYRVEQDTVWVVAVWHGRQVPDQPDDEAGV